MVKDEKNPLQIYDMSKFENRLRSLSNWPVRFIPIKDMAEGGFFYYGNGVDDCVDCYACHKTFGGWEQDDDPLTAHEIVNKECPHHKSRKSHREDEPMDVDFDSSKFNMTLEENRLATFQSWPNDKSHIDTKAMAKSGFFYTQIKNDGELTVECFACHFSFGGWEFGDDPYHKHRTMVPHCPFVKMNKADIWYPFDMTNMFNRLHTFKKLETEDDKKLQLAKQGFHLISDGVTIWCFAHCTAFKIDSRDNIDPLQYDHKESCKWKKIEKLNISMNDDDMDFLPVDQDGLELKMSMLNMTDKNNRIESLKKTAIDETAREKMAESGFYFLDVVEHQERVACFACHEIFDVRQMGNEPKLTHSNRAPKCPYVMWMSHSENKTHVYPDPSLPYLWSTMDMLLEENRLKTLEHWPIFFIDRHELAKSGLVYVGDGLEDRVQCFVCKVNLAYWKIGNCPDEEHKRWKPDCPFVLGDPKERKFNYNPLYPKYASTMARTRSFMEWPRGLGQKSETMVDAGFFYTECNDMVKCYYCGICLKSWMPDDDPWAEHARWNPSCDLVRLHKGAEFIKNIISEKRHLQRPVLVDKPAYKNTPSVDDELQCKVCLNASIKIAFDPCGHTACLDCSLALSTCPVCRSDIDDWIRLK